MSGLFKLVNSIVRNNLGVCQVFVVFFCWHGWGLYHGFFGVSYFNDNSRTGGGADSRSFFYILTYPSNGTGLFLTVLYPAALARLNTPWAARQEGIMEKGPQRQPATPDASWSILQVASRTRQTLSRRK